VKKNIAYLLVFILLYFTVSCKKKQPEGPPALPSVSTYEATNISADSCLVGGMIISEGNRSIVKKGICYGINSIPTLSDNVIEYEGGAPFFSVAVKNLSPNTTYYVRAFATNEVGIGYANNQVIFKTQTNTPSIGSVLITNTSSTSITCKVTITNNGGSEITSKGICYSTSPNPTLQNSTIYSNTVTDTFSLTINRLTPEVRYYIKAFASNQAGTTYSGEINETTPFQLFAIGYTYQGGIIFYLDDSGNHGLLAAPYDQSTNTEWGCNGIDLIGANDSISGSGVQNTLDIISGCTAISAAKYCSDLILSSYDDWYLPSKSELNRLYENLHATNKGNFSNISYWSSTESDANKAWSQHFGNNSKNTSNKNNPYAVRAIRAF
jgi:hypothetical protein